MSPEANAALFEQLKDHEGFRPYPYRDTVGKLTIGIGRNLDDVGITEQEAEYLCGNDVSRSIRHLKQYPWYKGLTQNRKHALIDMMFNLGPTRFAGFKRMIAAIDRGDFLEAKREALDSKWANQVGRRATDIAEQIRKG